MSFLKLRREDDKSDVNLLNINEVFANKIACSSTAACEMQSLKEEALFTSFLLSVCEMTAATATSSTRWVDGTTSDHCRAVTIATHM